MATETATRQVIIQQDGSIQVPLAVLERAGIKPGDEVYVWTTGRGDLNAVLLPKLTVDELVERYGDPTITELDWPKLQAEIEEAIAQDVIDEMRRNG
jgi:hypothetical protein